LFTREELEEEYKRLFDIWTIKNNYNQDWDDKYRKEIINDK
jgi:hypothetical protein